MLAAVGAAGGEYAANTIRKEFYGNRDVKDLTESEKQDISNWSQIASGAAAFAGSGGNIGDAGTAMAASKNSVENNYLSNKQQAQKDKELDKCADDWCKLGVQAKWAPTDLGQDVSFGAGTVAGLPAGLYDTVEGLANLLSDPIKTYGALKELIYSGDILGNATDAIKQSYIERINRLETEYQRAGATGSYNAGLETGKLIFDAASTFTGLGGVAKGAVLTAEKVTTKLLNKVVTKEVSSLTKSNSNAIKNMKAGNEFNATQEKNYPYNELYIDKSDGSGYYRVDSHNPAKGEIVSRKFTQLSEVQEATARKYISEAVQKYPEGARISNVPSSGELAGRPLVGSIYLEVPVQNKPVPQSVLDAAKKAKVTIRDTKGKIYK